MRRSRASLVAALLALALAFAGLIALGAWQMRRRAWKLDLIARVDARVHAAPVAAPGPAEWPALTRERDEYRRVSVRGRFLAGRETPVQAVTALGPGFWLMAPLATDRGLVVLVNRGFIPTGLPLPSGERVGERGSPAQPGVGPRRLHPLTQPSPQGERAFRITGLLRLTEPGGAFLRSNDPAADRWYSRDVAAIAAARKLGNTAPYFIDADAAPAPGAIPIGGLTVIAFPNNHLVYALTWYGLALMTAGAAGALLRGELRSRSG